MTESQQPLVLIADDNSVIRQMLSGKLKRCGYQVIETCTGAEAAQKVYTTYPDAIVLDLEMPEMTGFQVCRMLKSDDDTKDIPIIILTEKDRQYDEFWARASGADFYLRKSQDSKKVTEVISELLEHRTEEDSLSKRRSAAPMHPPALVEKLNLLLEKKLREVTILAEMAKVACHFTDLDAAVASMLTILSGLTDALWNFLGVSREEENMLFLLCGVQETTIPTDRILGILRRALEKHTGLKWEKATLYKHGIVDEQMMPLLENPEDEQLEIGELIIPLMARGKQRGVVGVIYEAGDPPTKSERDLIERSAMQVGITIDSVLLYGKVMKLAVVDDLTQVANRREVFFRLEEEIHRAQRYGTPLAVVVLDLDHFKNVNDRYGHLAGDETLRKVGTCVRNHIRVADIAGRIGGEEFLIVMPHTTSELAGYVAERIRRKIEDLTFPEIAEDLRISISAGVAELSAKEDAEQIVARADRAMYSAKHAGRNRVVCFPQTPPA